MIMPSKFNMTKLAHKSIWIWLKQEIWKFMEPGVVVTIYLEHDENCYCKNSIEYSEPKIFENLRHRP